MNQKASEIMISHPITVRTMMTIGELAALLEEKKIHGAPVVDRNGKPVGVVSLSDIGRAVAQEEQPVPSFSFYHVTPDTLSSRSFWPKQHDKSVFDQPLETIMSRRVVCAPESATASELARIMVEEKVHRVLITREDEIAGLVTTFDILGCMIDS